MRKQLRPFLAALTVFGALALTANAIAGGSMAPAADVPVPTSSVAHLQDDPPPQCGIDDCLQKR